MRFELTEGYQPSTVFKTVALNRSAKPPRLEVRKYTWIFCGHQGISRKKPQKKDYLLHFNHNLISFSGIENNNTLIAMKLQHRKSSLHIAEIECRLLLQNFFQNALDNLIFCPILRARMMKNRRSRQGRGRKGRYS